MKTVYFFLLTFQCIQFTVAQSPQEFFLDDWQPKTITSPEYINTPQPEEPATVTITVNFTDTISKVSKYIFGNNAVNWAGKMNNNAGLVADIKNLQPHVLRWPGGNLSQEHFWNAVQGGGPTDIPPTMQINALNAGMNTTNWAMTVTDYYELQKKTNSTGSICVNYAYARYGTSEDPVIKAAHYAANWVRYDNGRTKFWEIGNENGGSWEAGYEIDTSYNKDGQPQFISGDLYGRHSRVFIDSMRAAANEIGADIKIGIVVENDNTPWAEIQDNWNKTMLPENADKADFLITHSYFTPYNENSDVSTILNSPSKLEEYKNFILNDLKMYGNKDNLPLAMTEWNIFATGSGQAVSYINGIHATLLYGELIKHKFGMSNRWDLMNGWDNGNDHGLFARADEPGMSYGDPHAPFYYMYYFQKYFGDVMVNSTVAGSSVVKCYASAFSSGQSGVVLINKYTTKQVAHLKMENMPDAKSYFRYVLTGGTDNGDFSRKVFVNGHGPSTAGGGPANYETLKAYGKSINGDIKIELPPLSVTYVLVSGDNVPPLTSARQFKRSSIQVFPNPSGGEINLISPDFNVDKIEIFNLNGQKVTEVSPGNTNSEISIQTNLEAGAYIVYVAGEGKRFSKRLIIR